MNSLKLLIHSLTAALCLSAVNALPLTRVLLIEGSSNHDWQRRVEVLESILSRDGSFQMDVSLVPQDTASPEWAAWNPDFASYDVVLSGYSDATGGAPWPAAAQSSFVSYVHDGGGFLAFHEANQAFTNWQEYQKIVGLTWHDAATGTAFTINPDDSLTVHPPNSGLATGHGARADVLVKRHGLPGVHPIHAGLPASWMAADLEVVRFPRGIDPNVASNVTILTSAADPDPPGGEPVLQHPVEWTVSYFSGRVYASTYGHIWSDQTEPEGMRCAAFQETLVRALKWCAGKDPGTGVPSDFPSASAISLRSYSEGLAGFGGAKPVGKFSNDILPTLSIVPTGVDTVDAFPNLTWESPIEAQPWPGSTTDVMIAEMDGRIFRLPDDDAAQVGDKVTVLDIRDRVWYMNWDAGVPTHKHGGILGIAFHPQFGQGAGKDFLYVYYLHQESDDPDALIDATHPYYDRLSRFTWNPASSTFNPNSELVMIQQFDTAKGHDGGGLVFGGDGFLYLSLGDEGTESADATPHTQKLDDRVRSGVWRMDVDMTGGAVSHAIVKQPAEPPLQAGENNVNDIDHTYTQGYFIPNDNPWVGVPGALEEYYAIGLREPHRMSYDPVGNKFWIGDVGAAAWEEIDVLDQPGLNFQWNYKEGTADGYRAAPVPLIGTERGPIYQYDHSLGNCIIGGSVYRGTAIPELVGKYIFGDNGTQLFYALEFDPLTNTAISVTQVGQGRAGNLWNGIGAFGTDSKGELLLMQMGAGTPGAGKISRIKRAGTITGDTWEYPALLSETGVFTDLATLAPAPGMIPYDVNMPLWSSGLAKKRWVMIPNDGVPNTAAERITYSENQAWQLPEGTVFVKHFARPDNGAPLETRLLVHGKDGWGGVTYKWRAGENEADLVENGATAPLTLDGQTFDYLYPSRNQCNQCHQAGTGPVLGFRTRQLNRDVTYPNGVTANQIESFSAAGFIQQVLKEESMANVITSADVNDPNLSDEEFARSYLDSNCSHCHQPDGSSRAFFDARLTTPLANQSLICGPLIDGLGLPAPAVAKPGNLENSVLFHRMTSTEGSVMMPPLARGPVDVNAASRIANWLLSMNADSCTKSQSFFGGGEIGITGAPGGGSGNSDPWQANMVIQKNAVFTNATQGALTIQIGQFSFHANQAGDPVTPFLVKVNGPDNFTVIAIGTTRAGYPAGSNGIPFLDSPLTVTLQPGESVAPGYLGTGPDPIAWTTGGMSVWHGGGLLASDIGSVTVGQSPDPGSNLITGQSRLYQFSVGYVTSSLDLGNPLDQPGYKLQDGANSNLAINLTDTFTNTTAGPLTVHVDRVRFHANQVADPVTPFMVRVNGPGDFTVLAVGTPQTVYGVGNNDLPFSAGPATIVIAPGETIAPGFVDNAPDGTPGTSNGVVAFIDPADTLNGGDILSYYYDLGDSGATLVVGQAPVVPFPNFGGAAFQRDYLFSVTLDFVGDLGGSGGGSSWLANMVIQKNAIYTNNSPNVVTLLIDRFSFHAAVAGDPVTPFIVRVNGANNFTTVAIGNSRAGFPTGANSYPFSDTPRTITVKPGESIAPGYLATGPLSIGVTGGGSPVWHGGGPLVSDIGSVAVGLAPFPGTNLIASQPRDYHFSVSYIISALRLGNRLDQPGYKLVDGANSNFVINRTDTFTNTTANPMTVSVDRFRFHASRVTDPVTPFVVRINGPGDFTLLAVGTPKSSYVLGENDLPFSGGPAIIIIAPGETIAPGFVDNAPDGTPGTRNGAVSFIDPAETGANGDFVTYAYDDLNLGATLELGQSPVVPFRYGIGSNPQRDYLFSVTLGFGGKEDEDEDGLKDSWELAFTSDMTLLSANRDSDGDGMTDGHEYQAGTDPTDRTSVMRTLDISPGPTGVSAMIQTIPGRSYQVMISVDLSTWIDAGIFKASDWPANATPIILPTGTLPPGADQKLFIKIAPAP